MLQTVFYYADEYDHYIEALRQYPHRRLAFAKGEMMCKPGELLNHCYLIMKGIAKMSVIHPSGRERLFALWGQGSIYPIAITENHFVLEEYILLTAMTPIEALSFESTTLKKIVRENGEIAEEIVNHYGRLTNMLLYSSISGQFESVAERVAGFLLAYVTHVRSTNGVIELTHEEIASIIGATRVSVTRALKAFECDGSVALSRGKIRVLREEALATIASDYFRK